MVLAHERVFVFWTEPTAATAVAELYAAAFTRDGRMLDRATAPLATLLVGGRYSPQVIHGHLYVAYAANRDEELIGSRARVELVDIDERARALSEPRVLTRDYEVLSSPTLRETPTGAILLFEGVPSSDFRSQLHALPIGCTPSIDGDDARTTD